MTLAKVILTTAGSIIALYFLWQLVALPLIGWVIDRLTFRKKVKDPSKLTRLRKHFEQEPSKN